MEIFWKEIGTVKSLHFSRIQKHCIDDCTVTGSSVPACVFALHENEFKDSAQEIHLPPSTDCQAYHNNMDITQIS